MSLAADGPVFPPLLTGRAVAGGAADAACRAAADGAEGGLLLFDPLAPDLEAALVLAPEEPLARAAQVLPLAGVAMQNALGAIAPPEVGLTLGWDGTFYVNGARAGRMRLIASDVTPEAVPDWLVLTLDLRFTADLERGGATPDETGLHAEGCGALRPMELLESWARHFLTGLHRWEEDGVAALHREWSTLAQGMGAALAFDGAEGTFLGIDEHLGLLHKVAGTTRLVPLTRLVETP